MAACRERDLISAWSLEIISSSSKSSLEHSCMPCCCWTPKHSVQHTWGQLTAPVTSNSSATEKFNAWSHRLRHWHYLAGLLLHSARRILVAYHPLKVLHSFSPHNFFQSRYFLSSTYHFFLPLAAVTAATSTAYPPLCLFLCVSGTDTKHFHQTDLQSDHHATHHGHLSIKMSAGKCYWCHAGSVRRAVLMFNWLMSVKSSRTDPPYQASTRGVWWKMYDPSPLDQHFSGPSSIWDSDEGQVKRRWSEFLLCTHMHFSHQHPKLHGILDRLHLSLFFLKPGLIFSILFSFFTPSYFLYLSYFKLSWDFPSFSL